VRGAGAGLAVGVVPPATHGTVAENHASMLGAGRKDGGGDAWDRRRRGGIGSAPIAEPALFAASPALHGTVAKERAHMEDAGLGCDSGGEAVGCHLREFG